MANACYLRAVILELSVLGVDEFVSTLICKSLDGPRRMSGSAQGTSTPLAKPCAPSDKADMALE